MNVLRNVSVLCCFALFSVGGSYAQRTHNKRLPTRVQQTVRSRTMERKASELIAGHIDVTKKKMTSDKLAPVTYSSQAELLRNEELRFPADELYASSWDTRWVNPFRSKNIPFPDSFRVDCSSFVCPVGKRLKINSEYGIRRRWMHRGIDLDLNIGDTVRAAFSGKVRIKNFERGGYGNYLVIRHPNGLETVYGHLSGFLVGENQIVLAGQPIGLGGSTGRSTGPHLHFETRFLGEAFNPHEIIDFNNGTPRRDFYVIRKSTFRRNVNIYTSTSERIVYHRVRRGESVAMIARKYRISVAELCRLNGLRRKSRLRVGQALRCGKIYITTPKRKIAEDEAVASTTTTNVDRTVVRPAAYHRVESDETLMSIARQYGTTVDALCKLNNIRPTSALKPGQNICYRAERKVSLDKNGEAIAKAIPTTKAEASTARKVADNSEYIDVDDDSDNGAAVVAPKASKKMTPSGRKIATSKQIYYRVRKGDTLKSIARRYGMTVNQLCRINGLRKTSKVKVGRSLRCS